MPLKILVCGGGCAGPALAFWLSRAGHSVTVVERFPVLRAAGAQIDIRDQGISVAERMGLLQKIRGITVDEDGMEFVDEQGGVLGTMMANKTGKGAQVFTSEFELMRGDFVRLLYGETKDSVQYLFGMTVERHEQKGESVVVYFSDGTSGEYDMLVGADGQGSRVRAAIIPEGAPDEHRRFGLYGAYFCIPTLDTDTNLSTMCSSVGGRMTLRRTHSATESNAIMFMADDSPDLRSLPRAPVEKQKEVWRQRFRDIGPPTDRLLEGIDGAKEFYCQEIVQVRTPTWYKGRVVLLGDAAHCPSPFAGAGLSCSLVGAYVLAGEICKNPTEPGVAFANYEKAVRPFAEKIQDSVTPLSISMGMPKSWLGVAILRVVMRVVLFLRLPELAARFSSDERGGWDLPEYPEMEAAARAASEGK